jgi:hypothetical protein
MRRILLVAVIAAGTVGGAGAPAASADFPEQPNGHIAKGCNAVVNRSAATTAPRSDTANNITMSLLNDACLGG